MSGRFSGNALGVSGSSAKHEKDGKNSKIRRSWGYKEETEKHERKGEEGPVCGGHELVCLFHLTLDISRFVMLK